VNPLFADWHREVSVNLVGVDLPAREAAADGLADAITGTKVLNLVAVAYGQEVDEDADAWLREPFKEADPAFPMRGNDVEMGVLAAAVLEEVCRTGHSSMQVFAAYAVVVAEHKGLGCPIAELPETAARVLAELAVTRRTTAPRPVMKQPVVWTKALKESVDAYPESPYSPAVLKELFQKVAQSAQNATVNLATHVDAVTSWSEQNVDLAAEDTALLWWLLSGRSTTLGEQWALLPTHVLAVVAGRELAAAAVTVPAPPQSDALLQQLINANPQPKKPADVAVPHLDTPQPFAFLIIDIPEDGDPLSVARYSLDQSMLIRAWDNLS
jgi:hypothetical protein